MYTKVLQVPDIRFMNGHPTDKEKQNEGFGFETSRYLWRERKERKTSSGKVTN